VRPITVLTIGMLLLASHTSTAAIVYTIEGQLQSTGLNQSSLALLATYNKYGVVSNENLSFTVIVDSNSSGHTTSTSGQITYLPQFEQSGILTTQQNYRGFADLQQSDIDFSTSTYVGNKENNYFSNQDYYSRNTSSNRYSSGSIVVGSSMVFSKSSPYLDHSSFVQQWNTGDQLNSYLNFNDGTGSLFITGTFFVTQKTGSDTPVSTVPLPAPALLFASACLTMIRVGRRSRPQ
jgi:hypothetical protein